MERFVPQGTNEIHSFYNPYLVFHWQAEMGIGKIKERKRNREEPMHPPSPLPLFIYTPKDSRLRFLAPKHTSRLLFLSEVPHSAERLGDMAEESWGQGTSVHPPSLYMTFHTCKCV